MTLVRSAILISKAFPPETLVGVHRPTGLCKHLVQKGWRVTVLAASPSRNAALDPNLLGKVPAKAKVVRTPCPELAAATARAFNRVAFWRTPGGVRPPSAGGRGERPSNACWRPKGLAYVVDWLSWWLQMPDTNVGWLIPAVWAGLREACRCRPDVIFSTGPVWTSHLVGLTLCRLLRVPWVADFRDPWCGSAFREFPCVAHRRVNSLLEKWVVGRATAITCAADGIRRRLAAAHPETAGAMRTVLNGFDREQLDAASPVRLDSDRCVLLHSGTFYGPRSPVPLFEAVRQLHKGCPGIAKRLHVVLLGEPTYGGRPLEDIVHEHALASVVCVVPRVLHQEALGILKGANVALLFGQGGEEDELKPVTAKVYEYIGVGKPVLAIGAGTEALDVMRRGGCRVWAAKDSEPQEIASALKEIAEEYARGRLRDADNAAARLAFARSRMAEELTAVLVGAMGKH